MLSFSVTSLLFANKLKALAPTSGKVYLWRNSSSTNSRLQLMPKPRRTSKSGNVNCASQDIPPHSTDNDETILMKRGWSPRDNVVAFDGVCVMCNAGVDLVMGLDKHRQFKYAALQSESGRALSRKYGAPLDLSTMIYIEDDVAYTRSEAVLRIGRRLGPVIGIISQVALVVVPRPLRDWMYSNILAKYRYAIFGKKDQCRAVEPGMEDRFL